MAGKKGKQHPAIRGLTWHRHQYYSFYIPMDWQRFAWVDGHTGDIYGPDANDPLTVFAVDLKDLGTVVTADDLEVLAEGIFQGIKQLSGVAIESHHQKVTGRLLELETKYSFSERGQTRKRWARVFYDETRQIAMTAQASSPEKYDYWLPWFFEAMMTAEIHHEMPSNPY